MSLIALKPSIAPMISPLATGAASAFSHCTSTISPSMRVANFVKPTRQRSGAISRSQKCDGL